MGFSGEQAPQVGYLFFVPVGVTVGAEEAAWSDYEPSRAMMQVRLRLTRDEGIIGGNRQQRMRGKVERCRAETLQMGDRGRGLLWRNSHLTSACVSAV